MNLSAYRPNVGVVVFHPDGRVWLGHRVGLHPIWILFALIAGLKLMGFTGVLIAVPTAAVIGVLIRFAVRQYKQSSLYK